MKILEAIQIDEEIRLKDIACYANSSKEMINSLNLKMADYENILGITVDREAILAEEREEAQKTWDSLKEKYKMSLVKNG